MNKNTYYLKPENTIFHLIIFGIFIVSLAIRIYGAYSINITNAEAEVLLSFSNVEAAGSATFFYGLVIRIMQFLGVNNDLGFRIVNVIMGALITTFPAMFYREIGKRAAIIAALLLSFDPFGIANSIVFTGNIATLFVLGLLFDAILHDRNKLIQLIMFLFVVHGRGLGFFLLFALLFLFILFLAKRNLFSSLIEILKEGFSHNINVAVAGFTIVFALLLAIILKLPLSNIANDVSGFVSGWESNYQTGNYPIVYIFAIISSIPLAVITLLVIYIKRIRAGGNIKGLGFIWLTLTLLIIMFYPRHLMIDLIWVSLPLCIIAAIVIEEFISQNLHLIRIEWPFLAVLFSTGINLGLNLIAYVYRSIWGLDVTNTLLTILFIGIFAIVLLLYRAYTSSVSKALSSLVLVLLIFGGITQLSISARAIGSNKKPENEILWNGYYDGKDIVAEIVGTTKSNLKGTSGKLDVFIDGDVSPVEIWVFKTANIYLRKSDLLSIHPELVISSNQTINISEDNFQAQEIISDSYPLWTWDPVGSFFSTDYWNWFFFRNNLQYKEYNFIWVNRTLMNNKIDNGAN